MRKRSAYLTSSQRVQLKKVIKKYGRPGEEVRKAQAILLLDSNTNFDFIKSMTGYSQKHAFTLRRKYLANGIEAIADQRKGRPKELLTRKQRAEILNSLKKKPRDCEPSFAGEYWTTGLLGEYVRRKYDVQYKSKTSYYLIFREAKFTYHKPGRVYEKRDEKGVKRWRKRTKPLLREAFADPDTVILTEDEMILSTQTTFQKIWLPKGKYPKIEVSNTKKNRSVYGFLNLKTGREHAFKTEKQNMIITADILEKIRSLYPLQSILLLWDGAGWHRGSKAQEFIENDGNIQTHYYPSYSPEENPQEHVWKEGRSKVTHNKFIEDIDNATDDFIAYLNSAKFNYSLLGFRAIS